MKSCPPSGAARRRSPRSPSVDPTGFGPAALDLDCGVGGLGVGAGCDGEGWADRTAARALSGAQDRSGDFTRAGGMRLSPGSTIVDRQMVPTPTLLPARTSTR